jgi:hypothetical protein
MTDDYTEIINRTIRDLIRRLDEAVMAHYQATGHRVAVVYDGYRCAGCDTQFRASVRVVGDE